MFRIESCELTVADGSIMAKLNMSSKSYGFLYPGTAAEAAAAGTGNAIAAEENAEGKNSFVFPVEALDKGLPCAAWSENKELWYDRTLVFRADSLPTEAFREGFFATPESLGLEDGSYSAAVTLSGGSGRASVQSPCLLKITDGAAEAEIVWILTEIRDGKSVCVIPVAAFDCALKVTADTTAMSRPHEIDYTLRFDAATITPAA